MEHRNALTANVVHCVVINAEYTFVLLTFIQGGNQNQWALAGCAEVADSVAGCASVDVDWTAFVVAVNVKEVVALSALLDEAETLSAVIDGDGLAAVVDDIVQ